jgi:sugar fermentation stimulation protein A
MKFPDLVEGRLRKRYKRFLADVELTSGELVTAHCANPGSMKSLLDDSPGVWLSRAEKTRKLAYTWEVAVLPSGLAYVNPTGANRVVGEALRARQIPELSEFSTLTAEVKYGANSRVDFLLEKDARKTYVEVKNVTLALGPGRSAFPDSVTVRGQKHLRDLAAMAESGHRAVLFFCVSRTDARTVEAARDIDPDYASELRRALEKGVEVLAYGGTISKEGFELERRIPFIAPE